MVKGLSEGEERVDDQKTIQIRQSLVMKNGKLNWGVKRDCCHRKRREWLSSVCNVSLPTAGRIGSRVRVPPAVGTIPEVKQALQRETLVVW